MLVEFELMDFDQERYLGICGVHINQGKASGNLQIPH